MSFDHETRAFGPENHELHPVQVLPMLFELQPGDIGYVAEEHLAIDLSPQRKAWINKQASVYDERGILELCALAHETQRPEPGFARVIMLNAGVVFDLSHLEIYDWRPLANKFNRSERYVSPDEPELYVPIVYAIFNGDELDVVKRAITEEVNLDIDKTNTDLSQVFDKVEAYYDAMTEAEIASLGDEDGGDEFDEAA